MAMTGGNTVNESFGRHAGAQLGKIRRSRGWSLSDVDGHLGWPPGTLRYLERGKLRLTLEHAAELGSLYEHDVAELVESVRAAATSSAPGGAA